MSLEDFKQQFINELAGLTVARVTTLWKKSKTMVKDDLLESIAQSKTAQSRDQLRRQKPAVEIPDQSPSDLVVKHTAIIEKPAEIPPATIRVSENVQLEPTSNPVNPTSDESKVTLPRAMPNWSRECKDANVDLNKLRLAVNVLCSRIEASSAMHRQAPEIRILHLYQTVEDLLLLKAKKGNEIDVFAELR